MTEDLDRPGPFQSELPSPPPLRPFPEFNNFWQQQQQQRQQHNPHLNLALPPHFPRQVQYHQQHQQHQQVLKQQQQQQYSASHHPNHGFAENVHFGERVWD